MPACQVPATAPETGQGPTLQAVATVPPLAGLVRRIGGSEVEVFALLPEGAVPELYEPTPQQLRRLARARLFVQVGLSSLALEARHVAPQLASRTDLRIVDVAHVASLGGPDGEGTAIDPHLWLSPQIMRAAAGAVAAELSSLAPRYADTFAERLVALEGEIDRLDAELRRLLANGRGRSFLAQHPAWGHFAESYELHQIAIEHQGKEPGARALVELTERARRERCALVFVQRGFSDAAARAVAREIGAEVVVLDPLAEDWMATLRSAAAALSQSWQRVSAAAGSQSLTRTSPA